MVVVSTSLHLSWHLLLLIPPRPSLTPACQGAVCLFDGHFIRILSSTNRPWCTLPGAPPVPHGFQAPRSDRATASEPFLDHGCGELSMDRWCATKIAKYTVHIRPNPMHSAAFSGALWCSASLFVLPTRAASLPSTQPMGNCNTGDFEGTSSTPF